MLNAEKTRYAETLESWLSGKITANKIWYCNKANPNFVLVPGNAANAFSLYLMTPQPRSNVFPFGGHHRLDIVDGALVAHRAFSKSCLDFDLANAPGKEPMMFMSHLLDPIPTDIHIFNALVAKTPVVVGTANNKGWLVKLVSGTATISSFDLPEVQ